MSHLETANKINNITDAIGSKKIPFSTLERELIVALVRDRPIIEDKRTTGRNIELKKQAWEDLTAAFNSQPYVSQRNNVQLKRCWENMKTLRKKELSQEALSMRLTGDGPPDAGPSSDNSVDIFYPFIDLKVPNVIDSNSIEILSDLNTTDRKLNLNVELENASQSGISTADLKRDDNIPPQLKRKFKDMDISTSKKNCTERAESANNEEENDLSSLQKNIMHFTPTSSKKLISETQARIKKTEVSIQHEQALFELRLQRERILIERETNNLEFEKILHKLQIEKLELEISNLKQKQ